MKKSVVDRIRQCNASGLLCGELELVHSAKVLALLDTPSAHSVLGNLMDYAADSANPTVWVCEAAAKVFLARRGLAGRGLPGATWLGHDPCAGPGCDPAAGLAGDPAVEPAAGLPAGLAGELAEDRHGAHADHAELPELPHVFAPAALDALEWTTTADVTGQIKGALGVAMQAHSHDPAAALGAVRVSIAVARAEGDDDDICFFDMMAAALCCELGNHCAAEDCLTEAAELYQAAGDAVGEAASICLLAGYPGAVQRCWPCSIAFSTQTSPPGFEPEVFSPIISDAGFGCIDFSAGFDDICSFRCTHSRCA